MKRKWLIVVIIAVLVIISEASNIFFNYESQMYSTENKRTGTNSVNYGSTRINNIMKIK